MAAGRELYTASVHYVPRTWQEIRNLVPASVRLVPPDLVWLSEWRPDPVNDPPAEPTAGPASRSAAYGCVGTIDS
jgi:hypothetical protein